MTRTTLFHSNRSQAVRLAKDVAFPETVREVTILRDGKPVGYLTSGGYGYTIGKSIGYGYVRDQSGVSDDFLNAGRYDLVVAGETLPARIGLEPFYDPTNARVKS